MIYRFATIAGIVAALFLFHAKAYSAELGLTPSNVVSLWTNINAALVTSAEIANGAEGRGALETMTIGSFPGKKPADVLQQVATFRDKLDHVGQKLGLKPTTVYTDPEGGTVTPSVVFMNSGYVLDSMVLAVIKLDGERLVSGFYASHPISGKKPSDTYAMVELANRRMDVLQRSLL
jgi:hypothetical protein